MLDDLRAARLATQDSSRPRSSVQRPGSTVPDTGASTTWPPISPSRTRARTCSTRSAPIGPLHALVNNAGRAPRVRADILDASEESFDELIRTNLQGPYFLTQAIARDMLDATPGGSLLRGQHRLRHLGVGGDGLGEPRRLLRQQGRARRWPRRLFAARLAGDGIPVFEVRPGVIATDMTARVKELYDRRIADGLIPEGRWGEPADVGRVVAALVRGDVPYATGTVIHLDGGLSIPRL